MKMTSRDFCYWLQGFFEIDGVDSVPDNRLNEKQVAIIKSHLAMVFKHEIDPSMGPAIRQDELNKIHNPSPSDDLSLGMPDPTKTNVLFRC